MSTFLITGCAGFIGSHLTEALLARGDRVIGVDGFTGYYARERKQANLVGPLEHERFELVEIDIAAAADLCPLLEGVSGVFHLAAQPGVRGSWGEAFDVYVRDNLLATQRVFEAAAQRDVRVVWASSSSVYGNAERYPTAEDVAPRPISPYGVTKLACEQLAATYQETLGLDAVAMRYFTVYGPRQRPDMAFARLFDALLSGTVFTVNGTGEQSRDVTYVLDAVDATLAAFERGEPGRAYNVGGGTETTLLEAIAVAERVVGSSLALEFRDAATGDVRRTAADTSRARDELGWLPRIELEHGLSAQARQVAAAHGPVQLEAAT